MKQSLRLVFVLTAIMGCAKEKTECDQDVTNRKGAICNDGTITNRTDSSACDAFGGVREWTCK